MFSTHGTHETHALQCFNSLIHWFVADEGKERRKQKQKSAQMQIGLFAVHQWRGNTLGSDSWKKKAYNTGEQIQRLNVF